MKWLKSRIYQKLRLIIFELYNDSIKNDNDQHLIRIKSMSNVSIDDSFWFLEGTKFNVKDNLGSVSIEKNVCLMRNCNILMYENAKLVIEKNVFFNNHCSVNCLGYIKIGENTLIGEGV